MILLMPIAYATGFEQAFYNSSMPLFIHSSDPAFDLSAKLYLRAALGVFMTATSFLIGPITDRFGSRSLVLLCFAIHVFCQPILL
ncbi:hypothetical protein HK100_001772 [Physocladia obscura]|uniref:Major facilitator superfamily (MFS) profile domain-containing protein n=1 Tax=Physocladia obscura TaxID=109957 RepID=A0AAD5SWM2_9FUNG|nr:hypothetical protein HK100_001772 [Physocladia obscura]